MAWMMSTSNVAYDMDEVMWHDVAVIYWQVLSKSFTDTWRLFGK